MNAYLMQERQWTPGEDLFIESFSSENAYGVVFEDDGETAYFYAVEKDKEGAGLQILDALHIRATAAEDREPDIKPSRVLIIWSRDWLKAALIIDGFCHALFDFEAHGGYNVDEFPPPNDLWTKGGRKLSDELVKKFF